MGKPSDAFFLCKLGDLDDLSCKSFTIKINRLDTPIFLVKKDNQVFGYQNSCPHAQAPLDWNPDDFLDENREYIICAMHGARFNIEDGSCFNGPCAGVGLTKVELTIENEKVYAHP